MAGREEGGGIQYKSLFSFIVSCFIFNLYCISAYFLTLGIIQLVLRKPEKPQINPRPKWRIFQVVYYYYLPCKPAITFNKVVISFLYFSNNSSFSPVAHSQRPRPLYILSYCIYFSPLNDIALVPSRTGRITGRQHIHKFPA